MELITYDGNMPLLRAETAAEIANFERMIKHIKSREDALKKAILQEMEQKGIIKVETDDLVISYIAPTDREKFDSKKFRQDHSELYDEYISMIPVKASIRIKVKDHE